MVEVSNGEHHVKALLPDDAPRLSCSHSFPAGMKTLYQTEHKKAAKNPGKVPSVPTPPPRPVVEEGTPQHRVQGHHLFTPREWALC